MRRRCLSARRRRTRPLADGVTKRYGEATTGPRLRRRARRELTEMDALVAYLQILGRLTDAAHKPVAVGAGE